MRLEYFELIDQVEEIDVGALTIRVSGVLPEASPVFDGHFPRFPVLPGVFMLEFMNHAAGYLLLRRQTSRSSSFSAASSAPSSAASSCPATKCWSTPRSRMRAPASSIAETTVWVKDEVAADAEVVMISTEFPTNELAEEIRHRIEFIPVKTAAGA